MIEYVKVENLLDSFERGNARFFRAKQITNSHGFADRKTCRVIEHWKKGEKQIPPTILFNRSVGINFAQDGRHRLKVAYYYGASEIPIIILNNDFEMVMKHIAR